MLATGLVEACDYSVFLFYRPLTNCVLVFTLYFKVLCIKKDFNMTIQPDHTAAEDLALIRQMMQAGRTRIGIDGSHFVIWGAVLMLAFLAQYLQAYGYIPGTMLWVWLPAFAVGTALELLLARREIRPAGGPGVAVVAYSAAWSAVGITMVLHFVSSVGGDAFNPKTITVLSCGVIACAFFVVARVTELKLLNLVSFGWWSILVYTSAKTTFDPEMLLVLAAACALLILLPGQFMRRLAHNTASKA